MRCRCCIILVCSFSHYAFMSRPALTVSQTVCVPPNQCPQAVSSLNNDSFGWGKPPTKLALGAVSQPHNPRSSTVLFGGEMFIVHFHIIVMLDIFHGLVGIVHSKLFVSAVLYFSPQCFIFRILFKCQSAYFVKKAFYK